MLFRLDSGRTLSDAFHALTTTAALPAGDITVTMRDYAFDFSAALRSARSYRGCFARGSNRGLSQPRSPSNDS